MTIEVTAEHISKSQTGRADRCALARALVSAGFKNVRVDRRAACVERDDVIYITPLPEAARAFVLAVDRNQTVAPFAFEFDYRIEVP